MALMEAPCFSSLLPSPQLPVSLTYKPQETSLCQVVRVFTMGVKSRAPAGYATTVSVSSPAAGTATVVACGVEDPHGSRQHGCSGAALPHLLSTTRLQNNSPSSPSITHSVPQMTASHKYRPQGLAASLVQPTPALLPLELYLLF